MKEDIINNIMKLEIEEGGVYFANHDDCIDIYGYKSPPEFIYEMPERFL